MTAVAETQTDDECKFSFSNNYANVHCCVTNCGVHWGIGCFYAASDALVVCEKNLRRGGLPQYDDN